MRSEIIKVRGKKLHRGASKLIKRKLQLNEKR